MDRMRESLFSILGDLQSVSFLDLFCGSGVVGIEAASRGAEPVTLVESDRLKRQISSVNKELGKKADEEADKIREREEVEQVMKEELGINQRDNPKK